MISKLSSDFSSNEESLEETKLAYSDALNKSDLRRSWVIHPHKVAMIKMTINKEKNAK